MPSYRREPPPKGGGGSSRFSAVPRRPSSEESEQGPQYQDAPRRSSSGRSWIDIVVPESEQEDPYFDYSDVFSVFAPKSGPRRTEAPRREEARPEPERGSRAPREERVDPSQWFELRRIWAAADAVRKDPRFRKDNRAAVVRLAEPLRDDVERALALVHFFGVPQDEVRRYPEAQLWKDLIEPFLASLERSINAEKPSELRGRFYFQKGTDGSFWLAYAE